jgi:hypothetical protein
MRYSLLFTMVMTNAACSGDPEDTSTGTCEIGTMQCTDAEVLQECGDDGWTDLEDCAAQGMVCHAEMGHCMDMSDDSGM